MRKILSMQFFNQPTLRVAKELLGKFLVRRINCREVSLMITEVEAYDGSKDKASHASRGKTERNKVMFGEAGNWYVYFTYGMHWMLNIVTGPKDYPAAILIRGTDKINGPGRITKYLKIDKKFNAKPANKKTGLWIAASPKRAGEPLASSSSRRSGRLKGAGRFKIKRLPRVGVAYAGKWANKPYRFKLKN